MKRKIVNYISKRGIRNAVDKILDCDKEKVDNDVFKNAKGLIQRINLISKITHGDFLALSSIIIDLICNFKNFNYGWEFFKKAWNEKNVFEKYRLYGKGFGMWFRDFSTRRLKLF